MTEADLNIDLDQERREQVDAYFAAIEGWDHYQALDVSRDATREQIRKAYFALSKRFHPDTLFGKNLGPYKAKMEAVFQRVTDAYEVLGRRKRRFEYDQYLEARGAVQAEPRKVASPGPAKEDTGQEGESEKKRQRRVREHSA